MQCRHADVQKCITSRMTLNIDWLFDKDKQIFFKWHRTNWINCIILLLISPVASSCLRLFSLYPHVLTWGNNPCNHLRITFNPSNLFLLIAFMCVLHGRCFIPLLRMHTGMSAEIAHIDLMVSEETAIPWIQVLECESQESVRTQEIYMYRGAEPSERWGNYLITSAPSVTVGGETGEARG